MADPQGLKVPGNLDPFNRPVLDNADGSVSTTLSASRGTDQGEVLYPTVVDGKKLQTDQDPAKDEAFQHYLKTGQHLGIFDTPENADAYATDLHNRQAASMGLGNTAPTQASGDDVSDQYHAQAQAANAKSIDAQFQADFFSDEKSGQPAQAGQPAPTEPDPNDPNGVSLNGVMEKLGLIDTTNGIAFNKKAGAVAKDIGRGATEAIPQAIGGTADAINNVIGALNGVGNWINDNINPDKSRTGWNAEFIPKLPTTDKADSTTGGLIRSITQFTVGFIPLLRGVKLATAGGEALEGIAGWSQTAAAVAAATGLVFDGHEARLSNLIQEAKPFGVDLSNPVTDYLQAKPTDGDAEARFKNSMEALILSPAVDGFIAGVKAIKANRIAQGINPGGEGGSVAQDAIHQSAPKAAFFPKEAVQAFTDGKMTADDLAKSANFSYLQGDQQIAEAVTRIARAVKSEAPQDVEKISSAAIKVDDKVYTGQVHSDAFDAAEAAGHGDYATILHNPNTESGFVTNQGRFVTRPEALDIAKAQKQIKPGEVTSKTLGLESSQFNVALGGEPSLKNVGRSGVTVSDPAVTRAAQAMGITPQDLFNGQKFLAGNKAVDAERFTSLRMLLESAVAKTKEVAAKAVGSTDNADMYDMIRMMNTTSAIARYARGYASEAGRTLRATQIAVGSTAKQIEAMNEVLMQSGGPKQLRKIAEGLAGIEDAASFNKAIKETMLGKLGNAASKVWYWNLLSGPQTHIVNTLGNTMSTFWNIGERAMAAQFSSLRGTTNSVEVGEATQMLYGMHSALGDAFRAMGKTFLTGERALGKAEIAPPGTNLEGAISAERAGIVTKDFSQVKTLGDLASYSFGKSIDGIGNMMTYTSSRPLMAVDEFFTTINRMAQTRALAFRQAAKEGLEGTPMAQRIEDIMHDPPESISQQALDFGQASTFAQPLGETGQSFQRWANNFPPMRLLTPFIKTPVNIFKWAYNRTPLAFLHADVRQAIKNGGAEGDLALARVTMGSALAMTMVGQALSGNATGSGPSDPGLRTTWLQTHQPYSVKVGDTWYSYNRLDPFGLLMGSAASFAEMAHAMTDTDLSEFGGAIGIAASRSVFSKSFMKGPTTFLQAVQDPDRYGKKWAEQMMGTILIPAISAQGARAIDPVWRDVQSVGDAIQARVPGWSKSLPARLNLWGNPIMLEGGVLDRIANPIYHHTDQHNAIDKVMWDKQIPTNMPQRSQDGVQLTPKEYHDFVKDAGEPAFKQLEAMAKAGQFDKMSSGKDGLAAQVINGVIQDFRNAALAKLMNEPDFKKRWTDAKIGKAQALVAPATEAASLPGAQ